MKQTFQGHEWFPTFTRCVSSGRLTSVWEATMGCMLLYCTAGQEGGAQAQPFHSEQLGGLGNKVRRPVWTPAVSWTADAVFLPCLHKACSSWNSTRSERMRTLVRPALLSTLGNVLIHSGSHLFKSIYWAPTVGKVSQESAHHRNFREAGACSWAQDMLLHLIHQTFTSLKNSTKFLSFLGSLDITSLSAKNPERYHLSYISLCSIFYYNL